jgi:hypothetical protein
MPVIKTSTRAFIAAFAVLAVFHGIASVMQLAVVQSQTGSLPTPDQALLMFGRRLLVDCVMLGAGHWALRHYRLATRVAYGAMGGVAAGLGYAVALSQNLMIIAPPEGTQLTAAIVPILIGIIAGTLYLQVAGREMLPLPAGRTPPAVAAPETATAAAAPTSLFDGPVRVRFSAVAVLIASVLPVAILFVFSTLFMIDAGGAHPNWLLRSAATGGSASYVPVLALLSTLLPSAIVVVATHAIVRAMGSVRTLDYVLVGAGAGFVVGCMLVGFVKPLLLLPYALVCGGLMGAAYRRYAGLEPLPLPEAVLANDVNALVPADHPTRRGHTVITNG